MTLMQQECWLEIDLYWFQGEPLERKARLLFDRLAPLWLRSAESRRGLALCVGWLFDSVLDFNGDMQQPIPTCQAPKYVPWTYAQLRALVTVLHAEARKRGIDDFHVAIILLASATMSYPESAFEGWGGRTEELHEKAGYDIEGYWFKRHPEVAHPDYHLFDWLAPVEVPAGETVCREAKPTFGAYFAAKLAALAAATGLGAVVLRDGVFTPSYVRGGATRFKHPDAAEGWNTGVIAALGCLRELAPEFIIIGYDSGTSAMEEWRSHGFDLEQVARAGVLDLWITQTWASAWQDYWPAHAMGYTFQLARVLANLAMLAESPCKHMFLLETFDAWEPWDSLHQFPSKVGWEIQAYAHATLRHPGGPLHSAGFYSSWMNRGKELLPEASVEWLCRELDACATDLAKRPVPGGPCIVYHRAGLEWLMNHPADACRGEGFDDWIAMLMKFGLPALSVTRSEWMEEVQADSLIWPAPARIDDAQAEWLLAKLREATPVLFLGAADLLPEKLRQELGIQLEQTPVKAELASAAQLDAELTKVVGTQDVIINQRRRTMAESERWHSLVRWQGGPVFAGHRLLPCFVWEPPEWGTPNELHLSWQSVQSPQLYLALTHALRGFDGDISLEALHAARPICFHHWRDSVGVCTALVGNLETGVLGNSQFCVKARLTCVDGIPLAPVDGQFPAASGKFRVHAGVLEITLGAHKCVHFHLQTLHE